MVSHPLNAKRLDLPGTSIVSQRRGRDTDDHARPRAYFLATSPPKAQVEDTEANIERCRAALSSGEPPPEARELQPEGPEPPPEVRPAEAPVRSDLAGGVLTGFGSVFTAAGAGVMVGAALRPVKADETQSEFDRRLRQTRGLYVGGAVLLSVGLGLLIGGVTRYTLEARRRQRRAPAG